MQSFVKNPHLLLCVVGEDYRFVRSQLNRSHQRLAINELRNEGVVSLSLLAAGFGGRRSPITCRDQQGKSRRLREIYQKDHTLTSSEQSTGERLVVPQLVGGRVGSEA